jgi:hypothetical protein
MFAEAFRIIFLPILFVFINVIVEIILAVSIGIEKKGRTIKVLYRDQEDFQNEERTRPSILLDFRQVFPKAKQIDDVDRLATTNWWDYSSISINLCLVTLSADGLALFNQRVSELTDVLRWLFISHLIILFCVLVLNTLANQVEVEEEPITVFKELEKIKIYRGVAIAISFPAAVITLIALRGAL